MSSDLNDLIRKDLEQIPLPPSNEWTHRRRSVGRRGLRLAAAATLSVLVIVVGLVGGQVLRGIRDRIEADRTASGAGLVPGNDLVYLADGDVSAQYLQVVEMPKGQSVSRFVGQTYVGGQEEGGLMSISGDFAWLPVARSTGTPSDDYETYLQQIDLRRAVPLARIATGIVTLPRAFQAELPGTPAFPAATATSTDGQTVWLVVDSGTRGETATISRFDVSTPSAPKLRASMVLRTQTPTAGAMRSRIVALGDNIVAVIRDHVFVTSARVSADWYIFDAQLRQVAVFADDDAHRLPNSGFCGEVKADPAGAGWIVLCSDPSLTASGALVFLDGSTFRVTSTVPLDRAMGFALGMATSSDGRITILTSRPVVVRVDARSRTLVDARPVSQRRAWFEQLLPLPAAAKSPGGPSVVFSPDAHYAYLAGSQNQWWGPLSTIDLSSATAVATNTRVGSVIALGLSAGGERLYALASDNQGNRSLVLLVPQTLGIATRSATLANAPFAVVAVSTTSPAATGPSRDAAYPELPGEQPVLDAFRASSLIVSAIGGSIDESRLGPTVPARAFIVTRGSTYGGFGQGADVIFLPDRSIGDIRVCAGTPSAPGRFTYLILVNGQRVGTDDAVAPVYYLASARYFIIAYDGATRDALTRGLGVTPVPC